MFINFFIIFMIINIDLYRKVSVEIIPTRIDRAFEILGIQICITFYKDFFHKL